MENKKKRNREMKQTSNRDILMKIGARSFEPVLWKQNYQNLFQFLFRFSFFDIFSKSTKNILHVSLLLCCKTYIGYETWALSFYISTFHWEVFSILPFILKIFFQIRLKLHLNVFTPFNATLSWTNIFPKKFFCS